MRTRFLPVADENNCVPRFYSSNQQLLFAHCNNSEETICKNQKHSGRLQEKGRNMTKLKMGVKNTSFAALSSSGDRCNKRNN
ncbi:hypothetical protein X975_12741, partial [Stegodyphus mimosarum]